MSRYQGCYKAEAALRTPVTKEPCVYSIVKPLRESSLMRVIDVIAVFYIFFIRVTFLFLTFFKYFFRFLFKKRQKQSMNMQKCSEKHS